MSSLSFTCESLQTSYAYRELSVTVDSANYPEIAENDEVQVAVLQTVPEHLIVEYVDNDDLIKELAVTNNLAQYADPSDIITHVIADDSLLEELVGNHMSAILNCVSVAEVAAHFSKEELLAELGYSTTKTASERWNLEC